MKKSKLTKEKLSMFSELLVHELHYIDGNVSKNYHVELIDKATGKKVCESVIIKNFIDSIDGDTIRNLQICDNWVKMINCNIIKDAVKFYNNTTTPVLVENPKPKFGLPF